MITWTFFSTDFLLLVPNECLNELEGIRHFERVFQARHPNVPRWPVWFKSSLENAINQSVTSSLIVFRFPYRSILSAWSICCLSQS